jgi:group I intron endonuclease
MIVYLAVNLRNGLKYVGATSAGLNRRKKGHQNRAFSRGKKSYTLFHCALREYGWEVFEWKILSLCSSIEEMFSEEERWVRELNTQDRQYGYNMVEGGGALNGYVYTDELRAKRSAANKARPPISAETRAKMRAAQSSRPPISEVTRAKLAAANKTKSFFSDEHRLKLSMSKLGRPLSEETKAKISAARKKNPPSAESRKKAWATRRAVSSVMMGI